MPAKKTKPQEEVVTPEVSETPTSPAQHPEYDPSLPENKQRHTR